MLFSCKLGLAVLTSCRCRHGQPDLCLTSLPFFFLLMFTAWEQLVHNFLGSLSIKLGSSRGSVPAAEDDHRRETVVDTLDMLNHVSRLSVLVF